MKKIESVLFQGITENEWMHMLDLGCMRTQHFAKNTIIFHTGEHIHEIGIVLSGSVNIENIDLWGNKSILSNISAGQVFAESYALCQEPMMVDAVTAEAADILFLNMAPLKQVQDKESWSAKIMQNILYISVQKNLILSRRIFCTTPKTVRSRLFIYLSTEAAKAKSTTFQIPFDRQGLADYLNLDRSALSKELGKMRDEGILEFHKTNSYFIQYQRKYSFIPLNINYSSLQYKPTKVLHCRRHKYTFVMDHKQHLFTVW